MGAIFMYDAELREEKRAYQEIQREIDRLIVMNLKSKK